MTVAEAVFLKHIVDGISKKLSGRLAELTDNMHEIRADIGRLRTRASGKQAIELPESLAEWEKLLPDAILPLHDVLDELQTLGETVLASAEGAEKAAEMLPKAKSGRRR